MLETTHKINISMATIIKEIWFETRELTDESRRIQILLQKRREHPEYFNERDWYVLARSFGIIFGKLATENGYY